MRTLHPVARGALRLLRCRCRIQVAFAVTFFVHEFFRSRPGMASLRGALFIYFSLVVAGLAALARCRGLALVRVMVEGDGLLLLWRG